MNVKPLRADLETYLKKHQLTKKFIKQRSLFIADPRYPSLRTEVLAPKELRIYSFRIDKKYRAIFILTDADEAEIVGINDHYR